MKICVFDKRVFFRFGKIVSWLSTIISLVAIIIPIPENWPRGTLVIAFVSLLLVIYIIVWVWCNKLKKVSILIRNTKIVIKEGDLFTAPGKKLIPFNEYFDIDISGGIIDKNSLNGIYLEKLGSQKAAELYDQIVSSLQRRRGLSFVDEKRPVGKTMRYKLGTIYDDGNDFLLMAFSHFDADNRACLSPEELLKCLSNMWNEIDILRGNNTISLPLLGSSGLVRGHSYSDQQLLELLLWSFRLSGINLSHNSTLNIIIHHSHVDAIDFLRPLSYSD